MQVLKCTFDCDDLSGVVTRVIPRNGTRETLLETLVICDGIFYKLLGADLRGGISLGPSMPLYHAPGPNDLAAAERRRYDIWPWSAIWDAFSASIIAVDGCAVIRLEFADDGVALVSPVAGSVDEEGEDDQQENGRGAVTRFTADMDGLASDGCGHIYVGDCTRIHKIQLPACMRAGAAAPGALPAAGPAASNAAQGEAVVTTLPFEAAEGIKGIVHVPSQGRGSLVYATDTALYRVPLLGDGGAAPAPRLLAGREGGKGRVVDGHGAQARFREIDGLAVEADGCVLLVDTDRDISAVRRVAPDGTVTTLVTGLKHSLERPVILPNGYLALSDTMNNKLVVLDLGLKSPLLGQQSAAATALTGPPPRTLPADLGALLDAQPDGTSDLIVVVGEQSFAVHRLILSARCDYFKAEGTFVDGSAAQLNLPDADPEAFSLLLRFLYTGAADIPVALACAVAELADRLLLPELCAAAQAQVLAAVAPATVVGSLLWAAAGEARGPGFSQLLSDLKAWYVENYEAVRWEAGDSRKCMMLEAPDLAVELQDAVMEAVVLRETGAKRQSTHYGRSGGQANCCVSRTTRSEVGGGEEGAGIGCRFTWCV